MGSAFVKASAWQARLPPQMVDANPAPKEFTKAQKVRMAGWQGNPHFEGMLIWNGVHKNLDMLLTLDLKSGRAQEQGTFNVPPDGTIVREITGVYSEGAAPIGEARSARMA